MSIVRIEHNKSNPYVILNKKPLEDKNISWAAKGLWSYLMSRPDNWDISVAHLSTIYSGKGGGETAIYKLLNELIENGYCRREKKQAVDGRFSKTEYVISEFKNNIPHPGNPDVAEPSLAQKGTNKYRNKQSKEEHNKEEASPPVCPPDGGEKEQAIDQLVEVIITQELPFEVKDIRQLCKKYTVKTVREKLLLYVRTFTKKSKNADIPIAWLKDSLKKNYTKQGQDT